jgi:hypothetical protein
MGLRAAGLQHMQVSEDAMAAASSQFGVWQN